MPENTGREFERTDKHPNLTEITRALELEVFKEYLTQQNQGLEQESTEFPKASTDMQINETFDRPFLPSEVTKTRMRLKITEHRELRESKKSHSSMHRQVLMTRSPNGLIFLKRLRLLLHCGILTTRCHYIKKAQNKIHPIIVGSRF
jgi:hypothetical protein